MIRCYYGEKNQQASLYRTSLDLAVLAALQGCHFIITISGLSVALQLLDQAVLAALQGCHFIITISGPSVALQLLITLSPSHRLAPSVGLEVSRAATRTRSSILKLPIHGEVTFVDSRDCHMYTFVDSRVPSPLVVTFVDSRDPIHVR